jgi:hypothetical protein
MAFEEGENLFHEGRRRDDFEADEIGAGILVEDLRN